jgi:hypothetical protein
LWGGTIDSTLSLNTAPHHQREAHLAISDTLLPGALVARFTVLFTRRYFSGTLSKIFEIFLTCGGGGAASIHSHSRYRLHHAENLAE